MREDALDRGVVVGYQLAFGRRTTDLTEAPPSGVVVGVRVKIRLRLRGTVEAYLRAVLSTLPVYR